MIIDLQGFERNLYWFTISSSAAIGKLPMSNKKYKIQNGEYLDEVTGLTSHNIIYDDRSWSIWKRNSIMHVHNTCTHRYIYHNKNIMYLNVRILFECKITTSYIILYAKRGTARGNRGQKKTAADESYAGTRRRAGRIIETKCKK